VTPPPHYVDVQSVETGDNVDKNMGNVTRGHKANLKNTNTSEDSKGNFRDVLRERGVDPSTRMN